MCVYTSLILDSCPYHTYIIIYNIAITQLARSPRSCRVELLEVLYIVSAAQENGRAFVDIRRLDVEHTLGAGSCDAASLFGEVGHREGLVEEAQLAALRLFVVRVPEDTTVEECAVHVGNHRSDVARRVRLSIRGVLDTLEVLDDRLMAVQAVALVD
jgi:hypothetical protein